MPGLINQLAKSIRPPHSPRCTQQDKLFRTFAGFRLHNEHSTSVSLSAYQYSISNQKLKEPFL